MTYNLFFKNKYPQQVLEVIEKTSPDVLFVQELTPKWAEELNRSLGTQFSYRETKALKGTHGIGIYSKYKIENQKLLVNSSKKPYAQIVDLLIKDKKIQLINTHLASPAIAVENKNDFIPLFLKNYKIRKSQIIEINKLTMKDQHNYHCQLLIGDLNTLYSEPIFKRLKSKWTSSSNSITRMLNFNFPNSNKFKPFITLDYIMGKGHVKFLKTEVIKGGSSDHLAIMSKIKL